MMKVLAYAYRRDEALAFNKIETECFLDVTYVHENLSTANVELAQGFEAITIIGNCDGSREVLKRLSELGVKYVASRSAGYNNIDLEAAKEFGLKVSNAIYSPNCVADFTVMLALMVNRKVSEILKRTAMQDYSLPGLMGCELKNQTVGVIGTGRIGQQVIKNFSGFGCKIIAYDPHPAADVKSPVEYVDLNTLFQTADIITLHTPLFKGNHHLINKESIAMMKDGVKIINTARGELINTKDLIEGLKCGKISGAGLDVIEHELGLFHHDYRTLQVLHDELAILKQLHNVVVTNHVAFYTDQAVLDMVTCGLRSLVFFMNTGASPWEIQG